MIQLPRSRDMGVLAAADGANVLPSPSPMHPTGLQKGPKLNAGVISSGQHFIPKSCQRSAGTKSPNDSEGLEEALFPMCLPPSQLLMGF